MRLPIIILSAMLASTPAWAENRGVVVWNESHAHAPDLADADAQAVADAMRAAGFRTVSGKDLAAGDLRAALADLLRPDDDPGVRLVLLNGHFLHAGAETWMIAADAEQPDRIGIGAAGVSLAAVMELLADAAPGAVLVLGQGSEQAQPGAGLSAGLGELAPPPGVTVLAGQAGAATAAAERLLEPGASVGDALQDAGDALRMLPGGDDSLVLLAAGQQGAGDGDPVADREMWATTAAQDSAEGYRAYLARFPQGLYSAAAQSRLDQMAQADTTAAQDRDAWADAAAANTPQAYRDYLARFPSGRYADAAGRRLAELDAAQAPQAPARQAQPAPQAQADGPQLRGENGLNLTREDRREVQRSLNALGHATGGVDGILGSRSRQAIRDWQRANGHAVSGYLDADQLGALRRQGADRMAERDRQDRAYWDSTGAQGGARNLRAYLDRYPNGIHARQARDQLDRIESRDRNETPRGDRDDRAFSQARQQNTIAAYDAYLRDWPQGKYVRQARENRNALRRDNRRGNDRRELAPEDLLRLDPETILRELLR